MNNVAFEKMIKGSQSAIKEAMVNLPLPIDASLVTYLKGQFVGLEYALTHFRVANKMDTEFDR